MFGLGPRSKIRVRTVAMCRSDKPSRRRSTRGRDDGFPIGAVPAMSVHHVPSTKPKRLPGGTRPLAAVDDVAHRVHGNAVLFTPPRGQYRLRLTTSASPNGGRMAEQRSDSAATGPDSQGSVAPPYPGAMPRPAADSGCQPASQCRSRQRQAIDTDHRRPRGRRPVSHPRGHVASGS